MRPLPNPPRLPALRARNQERARWLRSLQAGLQQPEALWPGCLLDYFVDGHWDVYYFQPETDLITLRPGSFEDPTVQAVLLELNRLLPIEQKPTPRTTGFMLDHLQDLLLTDGSEALQEALERLRHTPSPAHKAALEEKLVAEGYHRGMAEYLYAAYHQAPLQAIAQPSPALQKRLAQLQAFNNQLETITSWDDSGVGYVPRLVFDEEGWAGSDFWQLTLEEEIHNTYQWAEMVHSGLWWADSAEQARLIGQALATAWHLVRELIETWGAPDDAHNHRLLTQADALPPPPAAARRLSDHRYDQAQQAASFWQPPPLQMATVPLEICFD
ncbi:MAG: hypothetical protein N2047_03980 [Meiothermus sp.]|nr:hypothetical protein [Meiothermus sp.]GIW31432.1 MAG: hypothetical protein KatS3mg071_1606 [Meiothermus sp.]